MLEPTKNFIKNLIITFDDGTYFFDWDYSEGFSLKEQEELRNVQLTYKTYQKVLEDEWDTIDKSFIETELIDQYKKIIDEEKITITRKKLTKADRNLTWNKYFKTDKGQCQLCGTILNKNDLWDCGHIISIHNGGNNHINNLTVECRCCNRSHGKQNIPDYLQSRGLSWPREFS